MAVSGGATVTRNTTSFYKPINPTSLSFLVLIQKNCYLRVRSLVPLSPRQQKISYVGAVSIMLLIVFIFPVLAIRLSNLVVAFELQLKLEVYQIVTSSPCFFFFLRTLFKRQKIEGLKLRRIRAERSGLLCKIASKAIP